MDYAREPATREAARRPAAEPSGERSSARGLVDLRRQTVAQRVAMQLETEPAVAQRAAGPEDEELQMMAAPGVAQLAGPEDEELQMKRAVPAPTAVQREETPAPAVNTTGLPDHVKSGVESLSGMSLDGVKVHYNSPQPAQLNALAYTQGTDIHVAPGQETHLPHETWHVVQQAQGRVEPTLQTKDGVSINDSVGLEHEADVMGDKAVALGA